MSKRLKNNSFPKGVNAVIFLLHKPAGQGTKANMLTVDDPRVQEFFEEFEKNILLRLVWIDATFPVRLGFARNILPESLDTCEGGRYSCYIGADMTMVLCSFDQDKLYRVSLRDMTIEEACCSEPFEKFRDKMRVACHGCPKYELCMGDCPLMPKIVFCDSEI